MPPLPLLPNQPTGSPDWYPGPGAGSPSAASPGMSNGKRKYILTPEGPVWLPENMQDMSEQEATLIAQTYANAIEEKRKAWSLTSGLEKKKIEAEIADMVEGRKNALSIAQMQADTSRYGVDAQSKTALESLMQRQREFDATHSLDLQKFGLDTAKAYTEFASTPDRAFMFGDFNEGMNRIGQGLGPTPYGTQGQPQAKIWEDFAALSGFDSLPAVQAGQSAATTAQQGGGMAQPGAGSDPRLKAATSILKAIPPSDGQGHDEDNWAALNAIQNVYAASKPGSFERMRPGQQKMFGAGLSRLGYYAPDAIAQMKSNNPHQTSVRRA